MTRTPRRLAVSAGLAVLLLSACGDGQLQPGAAAIVGDVRITTQELQEASELALADPQAQEQLGAEPAQFQRQLLGRLVQREVLQAAAESEGLTVTDGDVDAQLAVFAEGAGSVEALQQQGLQAGVSAEEFRPFIRDIVLDQALGDALVEDVDVPQDQLRAAFEQGAANDQVRSRHILVEDEATARRLLAQVEEDPSQFAPLAAEFSTDTSNAEAGGDLGVAPRGQFVPEFEELLFSLPEGGYGVVQTQFGWHVVNVVERLTTSFEEATPELRRALLQQEIGERKIALLQETAERLGIDINPRFGEWDPEQGTVQAVSDPDDVLVDSEQEQAPEQAPEQEQAPAVEPTPEG